MSVPFELEALSRGRQYQRWLADTVIPHLGNRILEVGAGIGNLSQWLPMRERLILTEADESLLPRLRSTLEGKYEMPPFPEIRQVDLSEPWEEGFASDDIDTIVSFNVLEHVEDDAQAVKRQLGLLQRSRAPGPKRWIAVVPAHPCEISISAIFTTAGIGTGYGCGVPSSRSHAVSNANARERANRTAGGSSGGTDNPAVVSSSLIAVQSSVAHQQPC
jgi:SAM-dependent methyltransferase